jgi:hypothetical protein
MNDDIKALAAAANKKAPLDLLEYQADQQIALALQTGAEKYGKKNFYDSETFMSTYGAAMRRHLGAWLDGEDHDPESGLHHLAHLGACVHIIFAACVHGNMADDRGPQPRTADQQMRSDAGNQLHGEKPPETVVPSR